MLRTPTALVPYALMLAAALGGLVWHEGDGIAKLGTTTTSGSAAVGGPFALVDQDGHARSEADFKGRFMLVYFGYSFCPDVCPTTLAMVSDALSKLGPERARIVPVFVSVDPDRDTPKVLKDYLKSFGPDFVGLTGDAKHIAQAERAYHVFAAKHPLPGGAYAMDHSGVLYLMGPDGRFVTYYEDQVGPDGLAGDLKARL
ncbi:MAG: SCO family protein [Alphaproteobacteria bacterium]|nr:SCO family protein [Alphaproteobacteria bacterium]